MYKKIAVIICYLGKLPWYFEYFVHSCKYNPTVDFYIVTDDHEDSNMLPSNVIVMHKTMDEINSLASQRLGFRTNITRPYKLCDVKPTYGFLFQDFIRGYDFWGHGDIDIIFGDIRGFITDELLDQYELINIRHDFLAAYFLLFKNNEKMNTLFMKSKDYRKVLSNDRYYCFEETNFKYNEFADGFHFPETRTKEGMEIESMMHLIKRLKEEGRIKAYFDHHVIDGVPGKLKWVDGKLYYKNKHEALLYHLIKLKRIYTPKRVGRIPDSFHISPTRIYV